jgi:hypothetical protein
MISQSDDVQEVPFDFECEDKTLLWLLSTFSFCHHFGLKFMDEKQATIQSFCNITGLTPDKAKSYLEASNWDINVRFIFVGIPF